MNIKHEYDFCEHRIDKWVKNFTNNTKVRMGVFEGEFSIYDIIRKTF